MNTKIKPPHTKGLWTVSVNRDGDYEVRDGGDVIAVTEWTSRAHLIAAAPELLAALRVACAALEDAEKFDPRQNWTDNLGTIRAAIARVSGGK